MAATKTSIHKQITVDNDMAIMENEKLSFTLHYHGFITEVFHFSSCSFKKEKILIELISQYLFKR